MKISKQTNCLPAFKKTGKMNPGCSKCKKIPSGENCLQCLTNLLSLLNSDYYEDENLSTKEQVTLLKQDSDKLKPVLSLFILIIEAYLDKKAFLERKIIELMSKAEIIEDEALINEDTKSVKPRKKIPITGKKSDIGQKIGKFFFNPDYKDGLHMERIHEAAIIELFTLFCESIDGTNLGSRYFQDNVNTGAIKDRDKKKLG